MTLPPLAFSGSPIDRADHIRCDADALAGQMNWRARLLLLDGLAPGLDLNGGLVWASLADAPEEAELVFLGLLEGRACFAAVPEHGATGPAYSQPQLWNAMQAMTAPDLALYGVARSLVDWHARHRFCARCGAATVLTKGGWQRDCPACEAQHFPRVDPVTIMLVEHGDSLLLGRQPRFPPQAYSALAGFVEPGETIEEAVAREVVEEAGVPVTSVRYIASQPWPFPSQLMIGCHAIAASTDLTIDRTELEDARWFTREQVAASLAAGRGGGGPFSPPPPAAIAHHLLQWWLRR